LPHMTKSEFAQAHLELRLILKQGVIDIFYL
jgi:hypothetical protein